MKPSLSRIVVLTVFILSAVFIVQAQATRTWVSGKGDDANACTRTTPCKTFAGAITKTSVSGEINCLDAGGFGPVVINKAITIDCTGNYGSILSNTVASVAVSINIPSGPSTVRLRGLSITGQSIGAFGVRIFGATKVMIEDSVIDGFTNHGVSLESTTGTTQLMIVNSILQNNSGNAINIVPGGTASAMVSVINSQLFGNYTGIVAQTADVAVTDCLISGNVFGIATGNGGIIRLSGNTISENTTGINSSKGQILSYGNNSLTGNGTNGSSTGQIALQ
jgi:hypothetical protein